MENLPLEYYSYNPNREFIKEINLSLKKKLTDSLKECIKSATEGLNINLLFLIEKINKLDVNKKFSSEIYFIYSKILEMLRYGTNEQIEDTIREIINFDINNVYFKEHKIESILTENWEREVIWGMRNEIREGREIKENEMVLKPLLTEDIENYKEQITQAIKMIEKYDPDLYAEFKEYVYAIKIFVGDYMIASSSFDTFGTIFISTPPENRDPVLFYLEHLAHELSHLHLYALMGDDKIVLNSPQKTYRSPIRPDPRPMHGIFHAVFVLARLNRLFKRILSNEKIPELEKRFQKDREDFLDGLKTVKKYSKLTEKGKHLIKTFDEIR